MPDILFLDWETRSAIDLKEVGLDNYASHPTTDIWCGGYVFNDEATEIWSPDQPVPWRVVEHISDGGLVVCHNAPFEIKLCNTVAVRYGWPPLRPEQCRCTMAMAYAMSLPGSLDGASRAVGLDVDKDMAGHRLMMKMAKPRSTIGIYHVWWDDDDHKRRLFDYCKQDVEVERQLYKKLMPLSPEEQELWVLDYKINQRGVYVDLPSIKAAISIVDKEQERLNNEMRKATGGAVSTCTANGQLADWIRWQGVPVPGVAKADVLDALSGELPDLVRYVLHLRQEAAKSSTAKLKTMEATVSSDGRVRNTKQYHAASTGRWGGRGMQPDNFPRPKLKPYEVEDAIELMVEWDIASIDMLYGAPLDVISSCLRGFIAAEPGRDLVAADFANIESRVLAWLAGADWKLRAFRDYDKGVGPDIYLVAVSPLYGKSPLDCKPWRQQGKVVELGMGFGGGVGAARTMAKTYFVVLEDMYESVWTFAPAEMRDKAIYLWENESNRADYSREEYICGQLIKLAYRSQNPEIERYWYSLEAAAIEAVLSPGAVTTAGAKGREVRFRVKGSFLFCQLPSKRLLTYPFPKIESGKFGKDCVSFMGVNPVTKKWEREQTYGGRICENVTQAVARDLLAHGIKTLEAHDYKVIFHVHDEAVVEIPSDSDNSTLHHVESLMAQAPAWADGLPMAAEGWRSSRYRK